MHDQPTRGFCRGLFVEDDRQMQEAVLTHLLDAAPAQFTVEELLRELSSEESGDSHDAILRAVRDLTNVGLLHRHDEFVFPTRAAVYQGALLAS